VAHSFSEPAVRAVLRAVQLRRRRAPRRASRARRRSCVCRNYRSILAHVRANLNRPGGLRSEGLAGSLANQEEERENQAHLPSYRRVRWNAVGGEKAQGRQSPYAKMDSKEENHVQNRNLQDWGYRTIEIRRPDNDR
jgi:hypothetical protein